MSYTKWASATVLKRVQHYTLISTTKKNESLKFRSLFFICSRGSAFRSPPHDRLPLGRNPSATPKRVVARAPWNLFFLARFKKKADFLLQERTRSNGRWSGSVLRPSSVNPSSQAADPGRSFHRSSAALPIWDAHALRLSLAFPPIPTPPSIHRRRHPSRLWCPRRPRHRRNAVPGSTSADPSSVVPPLSAPQATESASGRRGGLLPRASRCRISPPIESRRRR
jgi:hypothetical protein